MFYTTYLFSQLLPFWLVAFREEQFCNQEYQKNLEDQMVSGGLEKKYLFSQRIFNSYTKHNLLTCETLLTKVSNQAQLMTISIPTRE